jgi:hypothetical protein
VRKVDILSTSLGLKTVVLTEPSDQKSVRPSRTEFKNFFSQQNPDTFSKKNFLPNFAFFDQF